MDAVIFDMDGVIVDSEPLWTRAEISVFGSLGLDVDEVACRETRGLSLHDVVALRHAQHPWSHPEPARVETRILEQVMDLVRAERPVMPGAPQALDLLANRGVRLALATSSPRSLIDVVLEALNLDARFEITCSADDVSHGKPHPAVYLEAARRLGVPPQRCVAVEDSLNGLIAARAARMRTIAVPEPAVFDDPRFSIAHLRLRSLRDLDEATWNDLAGDGKPRGGAIRVTPPG